MRVVWAVTLILIVVVLLGLEAFALLTGRTTLSRFVWEISEAWPLFIFLAGFACGGLAVHFWWHWTPKTTDRGA